MNYEQKKGIEMTWNTNMLRSHVSPSRMNPEKRPENNTNNKNQLNF